MSRAILAVTALATLMVTGPALAFQCPKLINKIHDEADSRVDDASYEARMKADEAEALHKAGKLNDQAQRTVLCKDPFRSADDRVEQLIAHM